MESRYFSFFFKGRVAFYAILRAFGIKQGDEVIIPGFTCVVVPNPILYLGAVPVYADVDPRTFNIDPLKIQEKISPKTKLIVAQNTFGLSSDIDSIMQIARKRGIPVIEDCAHGFGGTYRGRENGTVADAAFFSSQWNKPFSTGIGGFAYSSDPATAEKIKRVEAECVRPSFSEKTGLFLQMLARDYLLNDFTYFKALKFYRWLSRHDIITGSSQGYELEKPVMPEGFLKGFSGVQMRRFKKEIAGIEKNLSHRKRCASEYKRILAGLGTGVPFEPDWAEHTFVKFPLFVKDRPAFFRLAEKSAVELGDWFLSPIHPISGNFGLWHYTPGECPVAEWLSAHIVNLHTHAKINGRVLKKIERFLTENAGEIIPYNEKPEAVKE